MSSNLIPFQFESRVVRGTDQNGDPWFILRDLLDAMESTTKVTDAVESVKQGLGDGFASDVPILDSLGRKQTAIIVSEAAATYLLARSNTEKGRELNRFIHVEVLPSIRKTGSYSSHNQTSGSTNLKVTFGDCLDLAKLCGFEGNFALLSADTATRKLTQCSVLELLGVTHLLANPKGQTFTPTELGKMMTPKMSAIKLNLLLEAEGLQTRELDHWMPSDKATDWCEWLDTGKRHSNGTPVKQLKWFRGVLDQVHTASTTTC